MNSPPPSSFSSPYINSLHPNPNPHPHHAAAQKPTRSPGPGEAKYATSTAAASEGATTPAVVVEEMVSLQSALLPEAAKPRPPCLSLGGGVASSTATSRKRKRDGADDGRHEDSNGRGEVVDGIELNFDAAPLPPEWQRCLDIKSGQIHYYNTRTHKRTWKDPRAEPDYRAAAPEKDDEDADCAPDDGLDLELNLNFEPRKAVVKEKRLRPPPADRHPRPAVVEAEDGKEMVPAVCVRCHMLVMMCRASPACPNCKFLHPATPSRAAAAAAPAPPQLKLGLQPLCCRD